VLFLLRLDLHQLVIDLAVLELPASSEAQAEVEMNSTKVETTRLLPVDLAWRKVEESLRYSVLERVLADLTRRKMQQSLRYSVPERVPDMVLGCQVVVCYLSS
jgi:hypothetical protein